jgi:hypothetical protein
LTDVGFRKLAFTESWRIAGRQPQKFTSFSANFRASRILQLSKLGNRPLPQCSKLV